MMKKEYVHPVMKIYPLEKFDIITNTGSITSGGDGSVDEEEEILEDEE